MRINKPKWLTLQKVENGYAVLALIATGFGVSKLATQPKVHSSMGLLPVWQFVAAFIAAGLIYSLFQLVDGGNK